MAESAVRTVRKNLKTDELLSNPVFIERSGRICCQVFNRFYRGKAYNEYQKWEHLHQTLLIKLMDWLPRFRGHELSENILANIATNLCIDDYRRSQNKRSFVDEIERKDGETGPRSPISPANQHRNLILKEAAQHITEADYRLLEAHASGLKLRQIAEEAGLKISEVAYRLKKIKARLRPLIERS